MERSRTFCCSAVTVGDRGSDDYIAFTTSWVSLRSLSVPIEVTNHQRFSEECGTGLPDDANGARRFCSLPASS
jgi:hypothetical protein